VGKSDENQIKQQQENTHCHTEQADNGNKLPIDFEPSELVDNTASTSRKQDENSKKIGMIYHSQYFFISVNTME
jgi:hypothetical protein